MKRPFYQILIVAIGAILAGFILLGSFLDAIANVVALTTLRMSKYGSITIAALWILIQISLRKFQFPWVSGSQRIYPKRLGFKLSFVFLGFILLLWVPPFLKLFREEKIQEPSINYKIRLYPSVRLNSTGFLTPNGEVRIMLILNNTSEPQVEIHNIYAQLWFDAKNLIRADIQPTKIEKYSSKEQYPHLPEDKSTTYRYIFEISLLHKDVSINWETWYFKPPQEGKDVVLWYSVVSSETGWRSGRLRLVKTGKDKYETVYDGYEK